MIATFPQALRMLRLFFFFCFLFTFFNSQAQDSSRLKIFLNCSVCDVGYIKSEMTYIDYVRDQSQADVQVFVVRMTNGSGGLSYEMSFQGYGEYDGIKHDIKYEVIPNSTSDQIRKGMLKRLEAGLILYLMNTSLGDQISFKIPSDVPIVSKTKPDMDPWNNWVFRVYGNGSFGKETSQSNTFWELGFRADQVTEEIRIRTNGELSQRRNKFIINEEDILSFKDRNYFSGSIVKSLSNHWSFGMFSGISNNTYGNSKLSLYSTPAIEYSIFPYSEVSRREITAVYRVGYVYNNYLEETVYFKEKENLMRQTIAITARFNQTWGRIWSTFQTSSFLHDFSKSSLQMDGNISFRVFKGLSARISADLEFINDQISLPGRGATLEEILLRQRQLATNFDMGLGIGLSYTFGSMYNNVINTRL